MSKTQTAVIKLGGHQYFVTENQELLVDKIKGLSSGKSMKIKDVLLVKNGEEILIGKPFVKGYYVEIQNLGEHKGKKVTIFKMKPKKRYHVKKGHRQKYWKIKIIKIACAKN